ncbi:MAG: hypothetical protein KDE19_17555, partial [Caldilineaceae bacterium]|nr:hypothetical protein [Caldilineaceae bacterium]
ALMDSDADTIPDVVECKDQVPCEDLDQDGHPNSLDIDSDGDGIVDAIEAVAWTSVTQTVAAANLVVELFPTEHRSRPANVDLVAQPLDSDGDGLPDYLDRDSDNDTVPDAIEGHDGNGDGQPDLVAQGVDRDGDGLDDSYDTFMSDTLDSQNALASSVAPPGQNGAAPYWRNPDDDGDGIPTADEIGDGPLDKNQNGIPDYLEPATLPLQIYLPFILKAND